MSSARFIGTMDEWMRDIQRRVVLLERRKHQDKGAAAQGVPVSAGAVIRLPAGFELVDNGDGSYTVAPASD